MNVAIIPARGGSKRVPRKNIKLFYGKPMLCYPIELAKDSEHFQLVVVSTDDDEIEDTALAMGAVVMRRDKDDGTKGTQEVAADVLKNLPAANFACVIYPCTPLLMVSDLTRGMRALQTYKFAMSTDPAGNDIGGFYWGFAGAFKARLPLDDPHTAKVILPAERCCDINTPEDWARAEQLYTALRRAP